MSFYVSTATFFLLHCDEWDRVVALPRHKFVTGATLLQLLPDKDPYHNRGRDQMRKKGVRNSSACDFVPLEGGYNIVEVFESLTTSF